MPTRTETTPGTTLRGLLTENVGLKAMSLVIAVFLFSVVRGAEDAQRSVLVDVVAVLPRPSEPRILTSDLPAKVRLTLRGSRSLLNSVRPDDLGPVQLDLSETRAAVYYFDAEQFSVPAGVEVTQVSPDNVPLTWAERAQRVLPITARLDGRPPPGLMVVGDPTVRPSTVTVRGPEPDLAALDHVATEPIALAGLTEGRIERRVALARLGTHVELASDDDVTVQIELAPEIAERPVPRLDVAVVGGTLREVRPARVRVTLRGPPTLLDVIDAPSIVPYVDASAVDPAAGTQSVLVRVRGIPEGVELAGVDPEEVLATPALAAPTHPH
jgi:YbbR domain-containing protein